MCAGSFSTEINPSSSEFNFDDYLEWLGTDYYRPHTIDKENIIVAEIR